MVTLPLTQLFDVPLMPVVGACRSIFTDGLSAVMLLPALSLIVWVAFRPSPSPVMTLSAGQATTPERLSAQVQWIVTSPVYQPLAPSVPLMIVPLSVGAV